MSKYSNLYKLHLLIMRRCTGNADEIAKQLKVSRACVFRLKNELKEMGAEIVWIHGWETYMYANNFDLHYIARRYVIDADGQRTEKEM